MKHILLLLVILLLPLSSVTSVYACSGGTDTPLLMLLEKAEVVVKARVLDVDTYGQSGVVEVIEYLAGVRNAKQMLVKQLEPVMTTFHLENRHGSGGCATLAPPFTLNEEVYLFLIRNSDGSYRPTLGPNQFNTGVMTYRFPEPDATIIVYSGDFDAGFEAHEVNETGLRAFLREYTGEIPTKPIGTTLYPMPAPIIITTTTGAAYILPVDYGEPVLLAADKLRSLRRAFNPWQEQGCNTLGCQAYSPNGLDSAVLTAEGVIINDRTDRLMPGKGLLFSRSNEAIAVWTENFVDLYTLRYPRLGFEEYGNTLLARAPLYGGEDWAGRAAWSPDGRLLAYSDAGGLWLLDVYTQTRHLLLLPSADSFTPTEPIARYFSAGGRYLALTEAGIRKTLDLVTNTLLPDGVFSPNERFFITYDTAAESSPMQLCNLTSPYPCQYLGTARDARWINDRWFVYSVCDEHSCAFNNRSIGCCTGLFLGRGLDWDYDPVSEAFLVLRDAHQIDIYDGYHYDLSIVLDEEIVTAEWLPPLYFESRTFSQLVIDRYHEYLESLPPV